MGVVSSIRSSKLSGKLQRLAVVVLQIQGLKLSSRDETSSYRLSINRISGRIKLKKTPTKTLLTDYVQTESAEGITLKKLGYNRRKT